MRLNYKGKVDPPVGSLMGPTLQGRYLEVAGSIYDPKTKTTEVWFDYANKQPKQ